MASWNGDDSALYRPPRRLLGGAFGLGPGGVPNRPPTANPGLGGYPPGGAGGRQLGVRPLGVRPLGVRPLGVQTGGIPTASSLGIPTASSLGIPTASSLANSFGVPRAGPAGGPPREKTARDLQREIRSRAKRRSDVHKPVLALVRRRIESKAALNHVRTVYKIPDFMPGLPVYDVGEVARSIADALESDGFLTEVYDPDTLYVSWDKSEVAGAF